MNDYLKGRAREADASCVSASMLYFTEAMKRLGVPTATVGSDAVEIPKIATVNGILLSARALVALWFSNPEADTWSRLPAKCRGAGAPGALLYADLVANRSFVTSAAGWPQGLVPGAYMQLWSTEAEYKDLRDHAVIPTLGHSCVFGGYVPGNPTRILVSDQTGILQERTYPYFGLRYVIGANLAKAKLVKFA